MMDKKKILIILSIFLILALFMSSVSASDNTTQFKQDIDKIGNNNGINTNDVISTVSEDSNIKEIENKEIY